MTLVRTWGNGGIVNDLDGDTRDMISLGVPHPAERALPATEVEAAIRRRGLIWIISGFALLTLDILGALGTAMWVDFLNFKVLLLLCLGSMPLLAGGGTLITAGLIECTMRPNRTLIRAAMALATGNGKTANGTRELVNGMIVTVAALERRVQQQDASLDRMAAALDLIASYLPENQEIHNWRGFNDAVRQRLAGGGDTPPPPTQRGRLGLVRNDGPQP